MVSVAHMRNAQGEFLSGYTGFQILSASGPVDRVFSLWFARGERYETHVCDQQPLGAYAVSIKKSAGEGSVSFMQQTGRDAQIGGSLTGNVVALPAVAVGAEGHRSSAQQTVLSRVANVQEIVFRVEGGSRGLLPGEVLSSISICVYTFSPELAEMRARFAAVEQVDRGVQTQVEGRHISTSPRAVERREVAAQATERHVLPAHTFGEEEWSDYFGVVVDPVPLPLQIRQAALANPTDYVLALIPSEVEIGGRKRALDFATGIALLDAPRAKGHPFVVSGTSRMPVQTGGVTHWVLLKKECFNETLGKSYEEQVEILQGKSPVYRTPTAWEAFLCIALHKIHTGEALCTARPMGSSWIRCQKEEGKASFVGGYDRKGLRIKPEESLPEHAPNIGMAGAL